jgi:BMFP domain-containing protein YqiC
MKYRKKPVVIEAVQYGPYRAPSVDLLLFLDGSGATLTEDGIIIPTLEGDHLARIGDFIIKGVHGEFYPCKPDIFEKTYGPVEQVIIAQYLDERDEWDALQEVAVELEQAESDNILLIARIEELEAELAKATDFVAEVGNGFKFGQSLVDWANLHVLKARTLLAELKGEQ